MLCLSRYGMLTDTQTFSIVSTKTLLHLFHAQVNSPRTPCLIWISLDVAGVHEAMSCVSDINNNKKHNFHWILKKTPQTSLTPPSVVSAYAAPCIMTSNSVAYLCHRAGKTQWLHTYLNSSLPALPQWAKQAVAGLAESKPDFYPVSGWTHVSQLHGPKVCLTTPVLLKCS